MNRFDKNDTMYWAFKDYPIDLQNLILRNNSFQKSFSYSGQLSFFKKIGKVLLSELLEAGREVYKTSKDQSIKNFNNDRVTLRLNNNKIVLLLNDVLVGDESLELNLISPDEQVRNGTINILADLYGVTGLNRNYWEKIAKKNTLTDNQVEQIHTDIYWSLPNWIKSIEEMYSKNSLKYIDLVPNDIKYYEKICGPIPNSSCPKEYFNERFNLFLEQQYNQNSFETFKLCLARDISEITNNNFKLSDDKVNCIISSLKREKIKCVTPFHSLGLINFITSLEKKSSYLKKILQSEFMCVDKGEYGTGEIPFYKFYTNLVNFVYQRLSDVKGFQMVPTFWKYYCAFTHSNIICSYLEFLPLRDKHFSETICQIDVFQYVTLFSLESVSYPLWPRTTFVNNSDIESVIKHRMLFIYENNNLKNFGISKPFSINKLIDLFGSNIFLPGPLEGSKEPVKTLPSLSKNIIKSLLPSKILLKSYPWEYLFSLASYFKFSEPIRKRVLKEIEKISFQDSDNEEIASVFTVLSKLSIIQLMPELGNLLVEKTLELKLEPIFSVPIIILNSAHQKKEFRYKWIKDKLLFTFNYIEQNKYSHMLSFLENLRSFTSIEDWNMGDLVAKCEYYRSWN